MKTPVCTLGAWALAVLAGSRPLRERLRSCRCVVAQVGRSQSAQGRPKQQHEGACAWSVWEVFHEGWAHWHRWGWRRWVISPTLGTLSLLKIGVGSRVRLPTGKGGFRWKLSPGHVPTDLVLSPRKTGALVWVPDAIWPYCL